MAYDGKLLRRAQAKYEEDRSRHEEEMARRRAAWHRPEQHVTGYLNVYARLAESADKGAIIRNR